MPAGAGSLWVQTAPIDPSPTLRRIPYLMQLIGHHRVGEGWPGHVVVRHILSWKCLSTPVQANSPAGK